MLKYYMIENLHTGILLTLNSPIYLVMVLIIILILLDLILKHQLVLLPQIVTENHHLLILFYLHFLQNLVEQEELVYQKI